MRHIQHLIDDMKFKFVNDLDEIGHYEIESRSMIFKDGYQEPYPGRSDRK